MGTWVPIGNTYNEDPLVKKENCTSQYCSCLALSLSHHHNTFIGFHIATWGMA